MKKLLCRRKIAWTLIPIIVFCVTPACGLNLIMFETRGCIYCKKWHEDIGAAYPKSEEGKIAPLRRIEMIENFQDQFKLNAPINVSPTFVLVSEKSEVGRIIGYQGDEFFWFLLSELLAKYKSPPSGLNDSSTQK